MRWSGIVIVLVLFVIALYKDQGKKSRSHTHVQPLSDTNTGAVAPAAPEGAPQATDNGNLLLGNPSEAGTAPNNFLLQKPQYDLSYNRDKGGPNWVSWHLDEQDLGDTDRGTFRPDLLLPASWRIMPKDYRESGYDRGHMCPSGDRTASREDNDATFCMSNMLPQAAALNRHLWEKLESAARDRVRGGQELYQIAGGIGSAGTLANGKINVPAKCWKVIVALPVGNDDLTRIDAKTTVISVEMPNEDTQTIDEADWPAYTVSLKQIEADTGLKLLSAVPASVKNSLSEQIYHNAN
jgi:endonuclease G